MDKLKIPILLGLIMLVFFLSAPAFAADTQALEEGVPPSARDVMGDVTVADAAGGADLLTPLWDRLKEGLSGQLIQAARSAGVALTTALLCSAAAALSRDGRTPGYMLMGGALAIMGACAGDVSSFLGQVQTALGELSDFSKALLPCVASAAAATGHIASGAARYTASALLFDVLMTIGSSVILPMIYAYAAVCTADAALPEGALGGPRKLMSWACTTLLTALTTVFTLYLALSGLIAGSTDRLAGSAAKTAISAALPVVGSILADAADTYIAGAQLLSGAIGAFGVAAVLAVCIGPLLGLGLHYLLFKAAACVSEPFADGRLSALLGHIGTVYGMALGLLGTAAAMLFISIVFGALTFS